MKNTTVKELIEMLKKFDQDAVVCHNDGEEFTTFEVCMEKINVEYVDDAGDFVVGNIIAIF